MSRLVHRWMTESERTWDVTNRPGIQTFSDSHLKIIIINKSDLIRRAVHAWDELFFSCFSLTKKFSCTKKSLFAHSLPLPLNVYSCCKINMVFIIIKLNKMMDYDGNHFNSIVKHHCFLLAQYFNCNLFMLIEFCLFPPAVWSRSSVSHNSFQLILTTHTRESHLQR